MKHRLLSSEGQRVMAVTFDPGEEAIAALERLATDEQFTAARFTAIGAFEKVTLGWFDFAKKDYRKIPIDEQVEVLALTGNIAVHDGKPKVHAHVVVGKSDGVAHGGHLLEGHVRPTLEIVVIDAPEHLRRLMNPELGLPMLNPEAPTLPPRGGREAAAGGKPR